MWRLRDRAVVESRKFSGSRRSGPTYDSKRMRKRNALTRLMLIGFRAAHNEPATEEFLVVQFLHGAFRFLDGLHLHKRKTFRALVVPIAYDLCVMHVANAIE